MKTVMVTGRFVSEDGQHIEGYYRFIPSRIWVDDPDGNTYPTMAPEGHLVNGKVLVYLNRTDEEELDWWYTVECPAGLMTIRVEGDGPLKLRDLMQHSG